MRRVTFAYAALFCVAMVFAYDTWTTAPEVADDSGETVLLDLKPKDLRAITFASEEIDVQLLPKQDALGEFVWVTTNRHLDSSKPTPARPATDGPAVLSDEKLAFKAGKMGTQLVESLAPLKITRRLEVSADDLANFGLTEPKATLGLERTNGTTHTFEVGDTAYGHKHLYLRDTKSGDVYVFRRAHIVTLERADSRLPEQELFEGTESGITAVTITAPNGQLELVQRNRDDASAASWTAPNSEAVNSTAGAWLDKVFRLRSARYVADADTSERVVAVKLSFDGKPPTTIEIFRSMSDSGEEQWFARSEFTRGLVQLSSGVAADAAADIATLFGSE